MTLVEMHICTSTLSLRQQQLASFGWYLEFQRCFWGNCCHWCIARRLHRRWGRCRFSLQRPQDLSAVASLQLRRWGCWANRKISSRSFLPARCIASDGLDCKLQLRLSHSFFVYVTDGQLYSDALQIAYAGLRLVLMKRKIDDSLRIVLPDISKGCSIPWKGLGRNYFLVCRSCTRGHQMLLWIDCILLSCP